MELLHEIGQFQPQTADERDAKDRLLALLKQYGERLLERDCEAGHITCSAFILSPDMQETLMAYHLVYQSVGWLGGHADGNSDLPGTALREAREETSAAMLYLFSRRILSIDILPVPAHEKQGVPVAAHLHYNVTYGLIAPREQPLADKAGENRDVRWIPADALADHCTEPHMLPIYAKLLRRMRSLAARKQAIPAQMLSLLLDWYPAHHRMLPWREDRDPYRVWVSEIMLQQTRAEAVRAYYTRFLKVLPDVQALAACPEDMLLKLWEGLGYYNRVRNMQKAAKIICETYGGVFPQSYAEVRALPGIGDYTAGAVCSICYGLPVPAVDGNVLRVMARMQENFCNVLDPDMKRAVTHALTEVYPLADCGMLTQALMELGATVCTPNGAPHCEQCPLSALCMAREAGSTSQLPVRIKKQRRRTEQRTVFVLQCEGCIALRRRPPEGLLASLWELPNTEGSLSAQEAVACAAGWGVKPLSLQKIVQRRHVFTHITWEMQGVFLECGIQSDAFLWADAKALAETYSLPTAFRCILAP